MEDKKVKAGSVAVGICLFIIAILLVVIVLVFYNSTTVKNNLQLEVDELKTSLEEKDKKVEELENKISKVSDVIKDEEKNDNQIKLELGKFSTDKIFDPGYGEGIVNINLKENKQFEINGSYGGTAYTGIYEIVDNRLICSATKRTSEEGGSSEKNVNDVFEFVVISENTIMFEKCKNDSKKFELSKNVKYINGHINSEIKLSELASVNFSDTDEMNNFIDKYYEQKVKITGYVSVYGQSEFGFSVGIGDSKTYNSKTMAGGIINDSEMIEKVKKLKQGDKISIIGTVKEYCWPISLEDATVVIEK